MFTRQQYLNGECTQQEYYEQIGEGSNATWLVKQHFGSVERIKALYEADHHLNNIPLTTWDQLALCVSFTNFKVAGDYATKNGLVCVLKAACKSLIGIHK